MKKLLLLAVLALAACGPSSDVSPDELARWEARAQAVTITRDDWGIPHIHGPTDADAVFGLMYAQAEDDFNRIEVNFLNSQGRLAEAVGEAEIWRDLRMRLFIDPDDMRAQYDASPDWLKDLMDAWADGLNYFLHTHPEVQARVLTRFEPWMALTFSEGSIGGDIERVRLEALARFYQEGPGATASLDAGLPGQAGALASGLESGPGAAAASGDHPARMAAAVGVPESGLAPWDVLEREPSGSNGFAISPSNTANGDALLLINPHTSFYFRAEVHVSSDEGLNAYGAVTWGQFFVYQGFNETAGWMHTSSRVDNIDEFLETVVERDGQLFYVHGPEERPLASRQVTIDYRTPDGMASREFTVYRTHHGPIVRSVDDRWVSVGLMEEPMRALMQSYLRTKAANYTEFAATMESHTNSSNNTVFADAEGNIAYFHSNFIPVRDTRFDWSRPVDGSDPATDWQGVHTMVETVGSLNPPNGWIQNTNNWPYSVSGPETSPRQQDFPPYMDVGSENPRGIHAMRVLGGVTDFTVATLIDAAFDAYLPAFEALLPPLLDAFDQARAENPQLEVLDGPVEALRAWDYRWDVSSVPTAVAVFWGEDLLRRVADQAREAGVSPYDFAVEGASVQARLLSLAAAVDRLQQDFGTWETPWGEINRFQRLTGDIVQPHDDEAPSIPVGFTSGRWGSLASFGARRVNGSRKLYGSSGNSFVAVVEFGDSVRARAVTAGGLSSDPASPHFNDQAERYANGDLRPVYFYPDQLEGHTERVYHPGG